MTELVLASRSPIRLALLQNAGLTCRAVTSKIDEAPIKAACRSGNMSTEMTALKLAQAKAQDVAQGEGDAIVIGADQILDVNGTWLGKPKDADDAAAQLRLLSNRSHRLVTAVSVFHSGAEIWHHGEVAHLRMVALDEPTIQAYLDAVSELACQSVGAYQIEGQGIRLFERVEGDYFSILGLPLVPLLSALRVHGDAVL